MSFMNVKYIKLLYLTPFWKAVASSIQPISL